MSSQKNTIAKDASKSNVQALKKAAAKKKSRRKTTLGRIHKTTKKMTHRLPRAKRKTIIAKKTHRLIRTKRKTMIAKKTHRWIRTKRKTMIAKKTHRIDWARRHGKRRGNRLKFSIRKAIGDREEKRRAEDNESISPRFPKMHS